MTQPGQNDRISAKIFSGLQEIDRAEWQALLASPHPLVSYDFLLALEQSGSVGGQSGWQPLHIGLTDATGRLQAALPGWLKSHSYGEYVFDHGWAQALEQAGGDYYPKFLSAIPFTPVPGPRLLTRPDRPELRGQLIAAMQQLVASNELSSAHVTFIEEADRQAFEEAGWQLRSGLQFHWHNQGYRDFDDFLASFASRKRKNVKKERASIAAAGLQMRRLSGEDIKPEHWDFFYQCYLATIDRKWGGAYLTRDFFDRLDALMRDRCLLVLAEKDGQPVAAALNFIGPDCLYGRNWGTLADVPNLHFETCYYQAIDFAIEAGLARVEAGAQGLHKVQRGYMPVKTASAHYISHPGLAAAVSRFCRQEAGGITAEARMIETSSPYRKTA